MIPTPAHRTFAGLVLAACIAILSCDNDNPTRPSQPLKGDINNNGVPREIADAVLYTNYFVYGVNVFDSAASIRDLQIAESDVNTDHQPLTVADLVCLIRVIIGYAQQFPSNTVPISVANRQGTLSVSGDALVGAAYLTLAGNTIPTLLAQNMSLNYAYDADENLTRVLVYSMQAEGFTGQFLTVPGTVISLEMATAEGAPVSPGEEDRPPVMLSQNYPNPFSGSTTISFGTRIATAYTLTICNSMGDVVAVFTGEVEPGYWDTTWDATDYPGGVYFYTLDAGGFKQTKTMALIK